MAEFFYKDLLDHGTLFRGITRHRHPGYRNCAHSRDHLLHAGQSKPSSVERADIPRKLHSGIASSRNPESASASRDVAPWCTHRKRYLRNTTALPSNIDRESSALHIRARCAIRRLACGLLVWGSQRESAQCLYPTKTQKGAGTADIVSCAITSPPDKINLMDELSFVATPTMRK